jgi:hypothetical protein
MHFCSNYLNLSYLDRGVDSIPPGGMFNFLTKNIPRHGPAQPMSTGNSSQPINVSDDTNDSDCPRTRKSLLFTKKEDIALVSVLNSVISIHYLLINSNAMNRLL